MPLHIVSKNITRIKCDAIVNAANSSLLGGGGVDGAIHSVAGPMLLKECRTLGGCETGDAKITKGYNLPSKYVIHTVGPVWYGGQRGEKALLESCYKKSLNIAREYGCETVAFPLISSGVYGYPKDKALEVAVDIISKFLFDNEMTVYLTIFDKSSYQINNKLLSEVERYINKNYDYIEIDSDIGVSEQLKFSKPALYSLAPDDLEECDFPSMATKQSLDINDSLKDMLSKMDEPFSVTLLKLIDAKGISEVECYKKANVSKQTWYKILNEKDYKPSKNTVIAFAIALQLTLDETQTLLATVGFALSHSIIFDVIIEYFILKGEYNIFTINETLFKLDQTCLGV